MHAVGREQAKLVSSKTWCGLPEPLRIYVHAHVLSPPFLACTLKHTKQSMQNSSKVHLLWHPDISSPVCFLSCPQVENSYTRKDLSSRLGSLIKADTVLLMPLNVDASHWVLLEFDVRAKTASVYDPWPPAHSL